MNIPRLVAADPADLGYVEWLLREEDLPHGDIQLDSTEHQESTETQFYLAMVDDEPIGVGGLEFVGDVAVLRSVVVEPDERGQGYGREMVEKLLERAATDASAMYLMTTAAEPFFADLDFERVDRDQMPAEVLDASYVAESCPSSATCMKRDLSIG